MKSRRIAVSSEDFYFGFTNRDVFNMGFSSNEKKIDDLNRTLNEICFEFMNKASDKITKQLEIDTYASSVFEIPQETQPFKQVVQENALARFFPSDQWNTSPKKLVTEFNKKSGNEDIEIMIEKEEEKHKFHISSFTYENKEFSKDAAKNASKEIDILAEKVINGLR